MEPTERRPRVLGIGDNVVDRYSQLRPERCGDPHAEGTSAGREAMFPGGNAVNVAVYARRAGADSAYWGVTGDDAAGAAVRAALRAEGVDLFRARTAAGPNAWARIELVDGDRIFRGSDDGVSEFSLDEGELAALGAYDVAHTAYSGSLIGQVPAMAQHTHVSFDFSHHWREPWAETLLPHLFLAAFSASQLSAEETARLLDWAVARGARWALATRGDAGAVLASGTSRWRRPAAPVEAVDTLGAGDAFIGTLLTALAAGGAPGEGLAAAARAAAGACAAHGAFGHGAPLAPSPPPPSPQLPQLTPDHQDQAGTA